jgi:hypothetical protein
MNQKLVALSLIIVMVASPPTVAGLALTTTVAAATATQTRTATTLDLKMQNSGYIYTLYGALGAGSAQSPRITGAPIALQVSTDDSHWNNAALTTTNAAGDYTLYLALTPGHTYYFRTYYPGSTMLLRSTRTL